MVLPLGTANNIARSLGVEGKVKDLVAGLEKARKQRFDIGLACGPWGRRLFVEAVGVGPLTEAMVRIDSVKIERGDGVKLGRDTFRKALGEAKPIQVGMSVDGRKFDQEVLLVEIMNIRYAGPGIALAPKGGLGDGLFDIITIQPDQRRDMLAWLGVSEPNVPPPVTLQQGRNVSLSWEGSPLRLDDVSPTSANRGDRITVELEREGLTILVPRRPKDSKPEKGRSKRKKAS
jgi:diacylglycerol kinase family enzyme